MDEPHSDAAGAAAEAILAVENAALAIVVASPEGRVQMANRALREMLGHAEDDLTGRPVWDFAADVRTARRHWQELLDAGQTPERPFELLRRDGTSVGVRASSIVVAAADGSPQRIITRLAPL
jgi:PAS domain S-box-containing protein